MKKFLYSLFVGLTLTFLLSGCTKFLDTVPDERTQLNDIDKVKALLVSAYPELSFAALVHFRCDKVSDLGATSLGGQPISLLSFAGEEFTWQEQINPMSNDREERFWTGCYSAIAASNHALAALEKLPKNSESYKSALGEAYITRAFAHFYLVSLFSELYSPMTASLYPGIPYVTEPEDEPIKTYERGTVEQTYKMIETDLEAGLPLMTDGAGFKAPKYHFTRTSANAFATRFYLLKGDYTNVVKYASLIIPNPTNFTQILDEGGTPLTNKVDGSPVQNIDPADASISYVAGNFHNINSYSMAGSSIGVMNMFSKASNPSNLLLGAPITSIGLTNYNSYTRFGMTQRDLTNLIGFDSGTTGDNIYRSITYISRNIYFIPKFSYEIKKTSISAGSGVPYSVMPMLRMEEVLLNRAEAYVMLDQYDKALADMNLFLSQRIVEDISTPTARIYNSQKLYLSKDRVLAATADQMDAESFINKYNETASWSQLKKALIVMILRYRDCEFWQEGLRWYDIRRWNIPVKHTMSSGQSNTLAPGDGRRLLQIPESALLSGVEQNDRQNIDDVWN